MKEILIAGILIYALWVVCYLTGERLFRKGKKKRQTAPLKPAQKSAEDDIIVKSAFTLCHSLPEASSDQNQKKALDNSDIFVPSQEAPSPVRVPDEALDETFSRSVEDNPPMDIDVPLEYEYEDDSEQADDFADEEEEPWLQGDVMLAESSTFEEMGAAVRTVVRHENATLPEKEKAGGVLVEIRQTDLFEQLVQSAPGRGDIVSEAMSLHLEAYRRQLEEEAEAAGTVRKREAPRDFDVNDFV